MIDNEIRKKYRQAINDLKVAFTKLGYIEYVSRLLKD